MDGKYHLNNDATWCIPVVTVIGLSFPRALDELASSTWWKYISQTMTQCRWTVEQSARVPEGTRWSPSVHGLAPDFPAPNAEKEPRRWLFSVTIATQLHPWLTRVVGNNKITRQVTSTPCLQWRDIFRLRNDFAASNLDISSINGGLITLIRLYQRKSVQRQWTTTDLSHWWITQLNS